MVSFSIDERRSFLADQTVFGSAGEVALQRLAEIARVRALRANEQLFSMGQRCDALYFVVAGTGRLVQTARGGRQRILHRATAGDMVAAVPFFDGKGYPATFVAEEDALVVELPRDGLLDLVQNDPRVALSILGGLVGRLRKMTQLVAQMSFEDTTHRLWDYLMRESEPEVPGKEFPRAVDPVATRESIAQAIGTVREVVSRRLSALVASGHLRVEGRRVLLLRPFR